MPFQPKNMASTQIIGTAGAAAAVLAFGINLYPPTMSAVGGQATVRLVNRTATTLPNSTRKRDGESSVSNLNLGTATNEAFFHTESSERETSSSERVVGEIRRWNVLPANWDGEGAIVPLSSSLKEAESFVRLLDHKMLAPEPMLNANGRAGLFWKNSSLYADLEFLGDGRMAYYIEQNGDKHKGVLNFNSKIMPPVFEALLLV